MKKIISNQSPSQRYQPPTSNELSKKLIDLSDEDLSIVLRNVQKAKQLVSSHESSQADVNRVDTIEHMLEPRHFFSYTPGQIERLIGMMKNINTRGSSGKSLLHLLAESASVKNESRETENLYRSHHISILFKTCIARGAYLNALCSRELLPIHYTRDFYSSEQVGDSEQYIILTNPSKCPNGKFTALHQAAKTGDIKQIVAIFSDASTAVDIDALTETYETPLFLAAKHNQLPAVRVLLGLGANPNGALPNGKTPFSVSLENEAITAALLAAGARPGMCKLTPRTVTFPGSSPEERTALQHSVDLASIQRNTLERNARHRFVKTAQASLVDLTIPIDLSRLKNPHELNPCQYFIAGATLVNPYNFLLGADGYQVNINGEHFDFRTSSDGLATEISSEGRKRLTVTPPLGDNRTQVISDLINQGPSQFYQSQWQGDDSTDFRFTKLNWILMSWAAIDINTTHPQLNAVDNRSARISLYRKRTEAFNQRYRELCLQLFVPNLPAILRASGFSSAEKLQAQNLYNRLTQDPGAHFAPNQRPPLKKGK